jgi:hypothetical protein
VRAEEDDRGAAAAPGPEGARTVPQDHLAACLLHGEVGRPVERSDHPDARDAARVG